MRKVQYSEEYSQHTPANHSAGVCSFQRDISAQVFSPLCLRMCQIQQGLLGFFTIHAHHFLRPNLRASNRLFSQHVLRC